MEKPLRKSSMKEIERRGLKAFFFDSDAVPFLSCGVRKHMHKYRRFPR